MKRIILGFILMAGQIHGQVAYYLGSSFTNIVEQEGLPDHIVPKRGNHIAEDSISWVYERGLELIISNDRVSLIYLKPYYRGDIGGLYMGCSPQFAIDLLGTPLFVDGDEMLLKNEDCYYRLIFVNDRLNNISIASDMADF
jgi:hypothetical protein